nr:uncharacterized protein LOC123494609 [Aegilops tauschii subsp. strangulata]
MHTYRNKSNQAMASSHQLLGLTHGKHRLLLEHLMQNPWCKTRSLTKTIPAGRTLQYLTSTLHHSYSCGAYTLKYMLTWDGDKITEDFTQAEIHIFSWKICSSLLHLDCNKLRKKSYKNPITKDEYEASIP